MSNPAWLKDIWCVSRKLIYLGILTRVGRTSALFVVIVSFCCIVAYQLTLSHVAQGKSLRISTSSWPFFSSASCRAFFYCFGLIFSRRKFSFKYKFFDMSETAEIAENQRKKKQRKLSHDELLRLLSVFEGELQARLVTKMIYSRYLQHLFNSLWDLFADLQKRGVFRDFDHETVFLDPCDPL